jgi:hypothetical protein
MRLPPVLIFAFASAITAVHAETVPALEAVKLLPKEKAARLAFIEGRDGTPEPDRWYLIVQDETQQNGFREFAVAGSEIVASRSVSQFAETVTPGDVIDPDALKIDSDRVSKLAQEYSRANNVQITTLNYRLQKEGPEAAPVWKVTCMNEAGAKVAELTVTASKGTVVSHEGFAVEPSTRRKSRKPKLSTYAETQVVKSPARAPSPQPPPRREPEPTGMDRVGNTLRKFFGGR